MLYSTFYNVDIESINQNHERRNNKAALSHRDGLCKDSLFWKKIAIVLVLKQILYRVESYIFCWANLGAYIMGKSNSQV